MILNYIKNARNMQEDWDVPTYSGDNFEHYKPEDLMLTRIANYGHFENFLDMIGDNSSGKPRILSNFRNTVGDADLSGQHICFTANIFEQPRLMPKLEFGLCAYAVPIAQEAIRQGWTGLISHDDFMDRLNPQEKTTQSVGLFSNFSDPSLFRRYPPQISTLLKGEGKANWKYQKSIQGRPATISIKGIIKRKEIDGRETYWVQFLMYTWREISKEFYDIINKKITELCITDPDQMFNYQKLFRYPEDANKVPASYANIDWINSKIIEARLFGNVAKFDSNQIGSEDKHKVLTLRLADDKKVQTGIYTLYLSKDVAENVAKSFAEDEYRIYRINPDERIDNRRRFLYLDYSYVQLLMPRTFTYGALKYPLEELLKAYQNSILSESYIGDAQHYDLVSQRPLPSIDKLKAIRNPSNYHNPADNFIICFNDESNGNALTTPRSRVLLLRINPKTQQEEICVVDDGIVDFVGGGLEGTVSDTLRTYNFATYYSVGKIESPEDAAIREVKEETGYKLSVTNLEPVGAYINYQTTSKKQSIDDEEDEDEEDEFDDTDNSSEVIDISTNQNRTFGHQNFVKKAHKAHRLNADQMWTHYYNYTYVATVPYDGKKFGKCPDDEYSEFYWIPLEKLSMNAQKKTVINRMLAQSNTQQNLMNQLAEIKDSAAGIESADSLHSQFLQICADANNKSVEEIQKTCGPVLRYIVAMFNFISTNYCDDNRSNLNDNNNIDMSTIVFYNK